MFWTPVVIPSLCCLDILLIGPQRFSVSARHPCFCKSSFPTSAINFAYVVHPSVLMTSPAYGWSTSRAPHDSCPGVTRLMIIGRLTPPAPSSNITNPESMPKSMFPTLSRDPVLASPKAWDPCRIMGAMWMRQPRCLGIRTLDRTLLPIQLGMTTSLTLTSYALFCILINPYLPSSRAADGSAEFALQRSCATAFVRRCRRSWMSAKCQCRL
ncbi:hypothetical protein BJ912DRAFT_642042 [Pholiota molesta]|nr:hypothetical protein BJ912DRAFT_642042 [Pholiota molesta]